MTTKVKSSVLSPTLTGLTSVTSNTFTSDIATGTAPFVVASTTAVLNLTASNVTTNANLTGKITSVGNATSLGSFTSLELLTALSDKTGSGIAVFATGPSFSQPILGTPQSGNLSNCTFPNLTVNTTGTAAGLSATLAIGSGGTNSTATPTAGGVGYGTGTAHAYTVAGTSGQVLTSGAAGVPTWSTLGGLGLSEFASGTAIVFYQQIAPTGWTKSPTNNDKALRVVNGTTGGSAGGTTAFSTAFSSKTPAGTVSVSTSIGTLAVGIGTLTDGAVTLTTAQIPSHTHTAKGQGAGAQSGSTVVATIPVTSGETSATGGGGSHTHGITGSPSLTGSPSITSATFTGTAIDLAVQYVDVIIATKN